jgi:subtilase family serine protease
VLHAREIAAPHLPAGARIIGRTPSSERLTTSVFLSPKSPSALAAFAADVSDVHSALFRHYLARGQFAARFGPTPASLHAVESFVRAAGLRIDSLSSNHLSLAVTGSVGEYAAAFATSFVNVRRASGAVERTTSATRLPASIASSVVGVIGLTDLLRPHDWIMRHGVEARGVGRHVVRVPVGTSAGAPVACQAAVTSTEQGYGGITDDQVSRAYGVDGLYAEGDLGQGQTVAIFELEPFSTSDVATFDTCYFGRSHTSQITTVNVDGGPGVGPGDGESALDIENVSAIAPDAKILVYQAPNTEAGSIDAYSQIVSDDLAQSVTTSWGFCESDALGYSPGSLAAENVIFEQAAAQGETVFNASGDGGNDACAYQSWSPTSPVETENDPASQPYVVGVGGTTPGALLQPSQERVWNDGNTGGGGGGGLSRLWSQPVWMPATADALSTGSRCQAPAGQVCRTVPDVTGFADQNMGITIYLQGRWLTVGGTSSSSPLWAAMLAEINASPTCQASASTQRGVGFASPLLYEVASNKTDYASGFNDITVGNNDIFHKTGGVYRARVGYDLASGLGSPKLTAGPHVVGPGLAASMCAAALSTTNAKVSSISPTSGSAAGGTPFVITGSGFEPGGTSGVAQVSFGTSPAASFVVVSDTEITGTTSTETTPTTNSTLNGLTNHSGGVLVSVTAPDHAVAIGPTFHYNVEHAGSTVPVVLQVGPTGGPGSGGNTVEINGTSLTGATRVAFGGVPATSFKVLSDVLITAVVPRWRLSQCLPADQATLGVCQTQVEVDGPGGASRTEAAKKPFAGLFNYSNIGLLQTSARCDCEGYPTISEYDYATAYSLRHVTGLFGEPFRGHPAGGDYVAFDGDGLNVLTLDFVNFGPANVDTSFDYNLYQISPNGTSLAFFSLTDPHPSTRGNSIPVSFATIAGVSNIKSFTYAPD